MCDPQPAALTMIAPGAASPAEKASMLRRASARAASTSPPCACRAPQQTWPAGAVTRTPLRDNVRAVA